MDKNWLIRTKNNHILGPVSKDKVRELINNGSIKGDDEVCSGNGYWIFIREQDLINRYVLGDEEQPFNPVSEAETVLANKPKEAKPEDVGEEESLIPSEENLEYPDLEEGRDDITIVGGVDISALQEINLSEQTDPGLQVPEDLKVNEPSDVNQYQSINLPNQAPEVEEDHPQVDAKSVGSFSKSEPQQDIKAPSLKKKKVQQPPKSILNDKALYTLVFIFFVMALSAFYFRKRIIKKFIETSHISMPISIAHAQIKDGIVNKKKVQQA